MRPNTAHGMPSRAAISTPSISWSLSTTRSDGRANPAISVASSTPRIAFAGANTAPSLASAANTGTASSDVLLQSTTRSPYCTPRSASTCACAFAAALSSANVSERSPIAAATRVGTARAPARKMSPIRRSGTVSWSVEVLETLLVDEVLVLRVLLDVRRDERAQRHHRVSTGTRGVERALRELRSEPTAFVGRVDLGVAEDQASASTRVVGEPREL